MILKLTEEQLMWVLQGTRQPSENVINMYRDHFVHGTPKVECADRYGFSAQFAYKKWNRFDELIAKKCEKLGLEISTVVHKYSDRNSVLAFDIVNKDKRTNKK